MEKENNQSFCYVDDTVDGLIKLMNQDKTNGPINIGNDYEMTIKELADKIFNMLDTKSKIIHVNTSDDPMQRQPIYLKQKNI